MKLFKNGFYRLGAATLGAALTVVSATHALAQVTPITVVTPQTDATVPANRVRALRLFQAVTAVRVPIDDPRVIRMEALIAAGNERGAAAIASNDPLFLDVQIRDLARKMSTRDESVRAPMSDFVATFIGVVKESDTISAKQLLTGNFTYRVDPAIALAQGIRSAETADIIQSNNEYADITAKNLSPSAVIVKFGPQKAMMNVAGTATVVDHPDPAGLLTARATAEAHGVAGTNRRRVEFAMREFMCVSMADWADANGSDERVGQDVTRNPGGSVNLYLTTCKSCHSGMDGFRGAFAYSDFTNNAETFTPGQVVGKMTRNATEYPQGFRLSDNSLVNNAILPKNADQFGWRTSTTGAGIGAFGKMLADSRGFSRCMVRRAFKSVCRRSPLTGEESLIRSLADQFETDGYHMRRMFENVAIQQQCIQ